MVREDVSTQIDDRTVASNEGGIEVDDAVYERSFPDRPLLRDQFRLGCVNPAIVLSDDPFLVAAWTDLAKADDDSYPAIKVFRQPLATMTGGPARAGMELAAIALYLDGGDPKRWLTFDPVVVNCVSASTASIQRVVDSIPDAEWGYLRAGLQALPRPRVDGQYEPDGSLLAKTVAVFRGLWSQQSGAKSWSRRG